MRWPTGPKTPRSVQPESACDSPRPASAVAVRRVAQLSEINPADWDALNCSDCPFLSHAYLSQLEQRGLVGADSGWISRHLVAMQDQRLLAALPLYLKENSFGEFVFDWAWAQAYQRAGLRYFPKLVAAVPFTPVPGARLLARTLADKSRVLPAITAALEEALLTQPCSSLHILFPDTDDVTLLGEGGYLPRIDCRFAWHNPGYRDFEDFLQIFSSRQRKNIRRERREVREAGISHEWITGAALASVDWELVHGICASTFMKRGQLPYLDAGFFAELASRMPAQLLVNIAWQNKDAVAVAIFFRDSRQIYGRYWGCQQEIRFLHFESCYYQGIEFAIKAGLRCFDPGTQGEHKLRRGFAPVASHSLHRFRDARMHAAVAGWLRQERGLMQQYIRDCRDAMPYQLAIEQSTPG